MAEADEINIVTDGNAESMLIDALYDAAIAAKRANNPSAEAEFRRMANDNGFVGALAAQNDGKKADFPKGYNLDLLKTHEYTKAAAGINSSLDTVDAELASPGTMSKPDFDRKAADAATAGREIKIDLDSPADRAAAAAKEAEIGARVRRGEVAPGTSESEYNLPLDRFAENLGRRNSTTEDMRNFAKGANEGRPSYEANGTTYVLDPKAQDDSQVHRKYQSTKNPDGTQTSQTTYTFSRGELDSLMKGLELKDNGQGNSHDGPPNTPRGEGKAKSEGRAGGGD